LLSNLINYVINRTVINLVVVYSTVILSN